MIRVALGLGFMAVLVAAAGCTMCCHPYDACGPVYDSCGGQNCSPYYRAGSILAGSPEAPMLMEQTSEDDGPPPPTTTGPIGPMQEGDVPGSERIVSVTDRVVEPGEPTVQTASGDRRETQGWVTRRPTRETVR